MQESCIASHAPLKAGLCHFTRQTETVTTELKNDITYFDNAIYQTIVIFQRKPGLLEWEP